MCTAPSTLSITLLVAVCGLLAPTTQAQWTVTSLHAAGTDSYAIGTSGAQQAGSVNFGFGFVSDFRAALWSGTAASRVDLHPAGAAQSEVLAISGTQQVGYAEFGPAGRAGLWKGTGGSWIDLSPGGASSSMAFGTSGSQQVGFAIFGSDNTTHAGLWSGTGESWVDLSPDISFMGQWSSCALSVAGTQQAGYAWLGSLSMAILWTGTAESWVQLGWGRALATSGKQQVGYCTDNPSAGPSRASLWNGTADSRIDLSPAGATNSAATGVSGQWQVGWAEIDGVRRAGLWNGTSASWEDLSSVLSGTWSFSQATGVWSDDETIFVSGYGSRLGSGHTEALLWSRPVPTLCAADLTDDGRLDFFDLTAWLHAFNTQGPAADFNADGLINFGDVKAYLAALNTGCP